MKMSEVRAKAKGLGLKTSRKSKANLIREIQRAEGNFDCFETADDFCDQLECSWRDGCLSGKG
jgi:hypothetical protein